MQVLLLMATALRVRLDRTYFVKIKNWKHYSKIIFKCVNSIVKSIFNEKIAEKWYLWIPYTVHGTHRTDKNDEKVGKCGMNSSHNFWPVFREQFIHALFADPQILFFINFFIKNGFHSTIHTFKNYFATVFSVFNFNKISYIQTDPK